MINATELRIGNWVEWTDPNSKRKELVKIDAADLVLIANVNRGHGYSPIPLTPEILEACGFEQHHDDCSNGVLYLKNVFRNPPYKWGVFPDELGSGVVVKTYKPIHSLHQLQNLYFALTGQELTYPPSQDNKINNDKK